MEERVKILSTNTPENKGTQELKKLLDIFRNMDSQEYIKLYNSINNNQKPDPTHWKTLDVNCLSECPDILVGDYEFREMWNGEYRICFKLKKDIPLMFSKMIDGYEYFYRLKQTEKTDEELAEEYCGGDGYTCMGKVTIDADQIKDVQMKAFIAGRLSTITDSEKS